MALFIVAYGFFYLCIKDKLLFTPDFGGSDAFHSNASFKYYLWESLRKGVLPFWTDRLGGGFPLIAETQIGAFFLPNLIIFSAIPVFSNAYSVSFVFHLFLLSAGMFLLLKHMRVSSLLSLFLSLTFTWSGAVAFRWVHFNFLQVFSLGPFLFLMFFLWQENQKKRYAIAQSFLLCQMIFAGHMQTMFGISLGLALLFFLMNIPLQLKKVIQFFGIVLFGFILALPQIIPTIQFSRLSARGLANIYQYVVYFVFNLQDMVGFFSPNALGSPQFASYATGQSIRNRIYWENTPYLGEILIIFLIVSSIYYFVRIKTKHPLAIIFLALFAVFMGLSFGGDSPLYFLFGIFPFSMFRTPSRYTLMAVFFVILYGGVVIHELASKSKIIYWIIVLALMVNCTLLVSTALRYHVFIDSQRLFSSLGSQNVRNTNMYNLSFGGNEAWYDSFITRGWKTDKDIERYLFLNGALIPNSSLLTRKSSFEVYTGGLRMRRNEFLLEVLHNKLTSLKDDMNTVSTKKLEQFLQLYNIGTIISLKPLGLPSFSTAYVKKHGNQTITTYTTTHSSDTPFYVPLTVRNLSYLEDVEEEIEKGSVSQDNSFAESLPNSLKQATEGGAIRMVTHADQKIESIITSPTDRFIALKKGWYPEWHLFIDGKAQPIYKTNLVHMGFYLSRGTHTVTFQYIPTGFYIGCVVALLGVVIVGASHLHITKKHQDQS